jgi:hypothetical protein
LRAVRTSASLELTCANTETSLPTIDLAIEIMEVILAHSPDGVNLPADFGVQTTGDSGQLAAQPEHLEPAAYDRLREATYQFGLPFDLCCGGSTVSCSRQGWSTATWSTCSPPGS